MSDGRMNTCQKQKEQNRAVKLAICASVASFLISASAGMAVDSITLILDASASLIMLVVALIMNFSLKRLHKAPDDLYHFGYGKYEPLTVLIQGSLIVATCVVSIKFAIQDIFHHDDIHSYFIPVAAMLISGLLGIFVFMYLKITGKRTGSSMLKAASFHWYTDTILSFCVCAGFGIGLALHGLGCNNVTPYVDPVMAIALAAFLIKTPARTVIHNVLELLDAAPAKHIRDKVKGVAEKYSREALGPHRLRLRKAGEKIFVEACFAVKTDMSIKQAEAIAERFERDIKDHFSDSDVIVYFKTRLAP